MHSEYLNRETIKAKARDLGFVACGLAPALPLPEVVRLRYGRWIAQGRHAGMDYLARHARLRFVPECLVPGVRTVVSVALPYRPCVTVSGLSLYAHGTDYHKVMRGLLRRLMQEIGASGRCFADTAPVLEKYWAWRCGLGWQGRHTQLVLPGLGSTHFLGELFIHQQADAYDVPLAPRCGACRRCVDACPSRALDAGGLDARRCRSYLTIEHRGPFPDDIGLGRTFYGCDVCLKACPHMACAPIGLPEFQPSRALLEMQEEQWRGLTEEQYDVLFARSAVRRAGFDGLKRNIAAWRGVARQGGEEEG